MILSMANNENNRISERLAEAAPSDAVSEQIQRALEMMKRVRTANADQAEKALEETQGNRYVLPEPLVLRVS